MIKEIVFRATERVQLEAILVANQWLRTPPSRFIRSMHAAPGLDAADNEIIKQMTAGDLVITQDIPLTALVLGNGGVALNPRGEPYTASNMAERLSMRNVMDELRGSGIQTGGPAPLHARD